MVFGLLTSQSYLVNGLCLAVAALVPFLIMPIFSASKFKPKGKVSDGSSALPSSARPFNQDSKDEDGRAKDPTHRTSNCSTLTLPRSAMSLVAQPALAKPSPSTSSRPEPTSRSSLEI